MRDPACEDLAEHFLEDSRERKRLVDAGFTLAEIDQLRGRLAGAIQLAVEEWFDALEDEIKAKEQGSGHRDDHP